MKHSRLPSSPGIDLLATLARLSRTTSFAVSLLVVSLLCLAIHFEIYRQTSASAFINRPELYFRNVFLIRDSSGQVIREVSYATGFASYITAIIPVAALGWSIARMILRKRMTHPKQALGSRL